MPLRFSQSLLSCVAEGGSHQFLKLDKYDRVPIQQIQNFPALLDDASAYF